MKAFYSILFAVVNPITSERVSIGLLLVDKNQIKLKISSHKQKIVGSLVNADSYQLLKLTLNQITNAINEKRNPGTLLQVPTKIDHYFSKEYINYLSSYSHNTLQLTGPEQIDLPFSDELFNSLYDRFVYKGIEIKAEKENNVLVLIKKNLYPKIDTKVNIDIRLSEEKIDKIIVPIDVNFIGKNGSPVVGKVFDFNKRLDFVQYSISNYVSLIKSFDMMKNKGKFYAIVDEPKKSNQKNHHLWKHVNDLGIMDFVTPNESDKIADYILKNNVQPYFTD